MQPELSDLARRISEAEGALKYALYLKRLRDKEDMQIQEKRNDLKLFLYQSEFVSSGLGIGK